ncbi:hypothetical protein [Herpetosiphon geysericola]|uniref:hypothetical protein n=1 Tax=Herpetosiphon geysericola TaxID=70996 RepID=UPI001F41B6E1|nr:hypothetical protein [Herpetosiphon geysericola]
MVFSKGGFDDRSALRRMAGGAHHDCRELAHAGARPATGATRADHPRGAVGGPAAGRAAGHGRNRGRDAACRGGHDDPDPEPLSDRRMGSGRHEPQSGVHDP